MGMDISGMESLQLMLSRLASPETAERATAKGLRKGAKLVQRSAKLLCTVDTGELRNSIEVTTGKDGAIVGTNVEHAPYVEYGTGQMGDPSVSHRADWVGMAPQPFLMPALIGNEGEIVELVKESLWQEINRR